MITLHFVGTGKPVYFAPAHITMIYSGKDYHPTAPTYVTCVGLTDRSEIKVHETPEEIRDLVDAALRSPAVDRTTLDQAVCLLRQLAMTVRNAEDLSLSAIDMLNEIGKTLDDALGLLGDTWPATADALERLANRIDP